jgi:hypothetical protein
VLPPLLPFLTHYGSDEQLFGAIQQVLQGGSGLTNMIDESPRHAINR